jgi:hypothetical protein
MENKYFCGMLKRSVAIVLMLLYVITVSGFALNLHYCFNRLSAFNIDAPSNPCTKVLEKAKMKCCQDRHIEVKVKDSHQAGSPSFWGKFFIFDLPTLSLPDFSVSLQNERVEILPDRGPPEPPGVPVFIKNCTFRI